jgi:hypothetical protein
MEILECTQNEARALKWLDIKRRSGKALGPTVSFQSYISILEDVTFATDGFSIHVIETPRCFFPELIGRFIEPISISIKDKFIVFDDRGDVNESLSPKRLDVIAGVLKPSESSIEIMLNADLLKEVLSLAYKDGSGTRPIVLRVPRNESDPLVLQYRNTTAMASVMQMHRGRGIKGIGHEWASKINNMSPGADTPTSGA